VIDVSATIQGKKFAGAEGLGHYLHDNPKYTACIARKLQAYSRGENSEDVSAKTVKAGYKAFADSGFHMRALIKGLVEAPEFFDAPAPIPETPTPAAEKVASK
jgi:hypothetical protein